MGCSVMPDFDLNEVDAGPQSFDRTTSHSASVHSREHSLSRTPLNCPVVPELATKSRIRIYA